MRGRARCGAPAVGSGGREPDRSGGMLWVEHGRQGREKQGRLGGEEGGQGAGACVDGVGRCSYLGMVACGSVGPEFRR